MIFNVVFSKNWVDSGLIVNLGHGCAESCALLLGCEKIGRAIDRGQLNGDPTV